MNTWRRGSALAFAVLFLAAPSARAAEGDEDGRELKWFGSLRVRPEYNDNLSDLSSAVDDKVGYVTYRANVGTSIDLDQDVTVLFDVQALGNWGEFQSPQRGFQGFTSDDTSIDFFRAYIEARKIFGTNFSVRAGRQPLVFGDEWLLGDSDFYGGTSWDGLRGTFETRFGHLDAFWAKVAETDPVETPSITGDIGGDFDLYGLWTDWKLDEAQQLDVGLVYSFDHRTIGTQPFQDKRFTAHVRYAFGGQRGFFFNGNAAYQNGTTVDATLTPVDIDAAAAAEVTAGYVWERGGNPYKLWGRYAVYSGDKASTPDKRETFVTVAPDFHARYGLLDLWTGQWGFTPFIGGPSGAEFLQLGFDSTLPNTIRLRLMGQQIWRDEEFPGNDNKNLGKEFGLSAFYNYGKNLEMELGVAILYPGASIALEPPLFGNSTARRIYFNTVARF